jgi:hypothetical protein
METDMDAPGKESPLWGRLSQTFLDSPWEALVP